jgi:uncharacterized protein DUF3558
MCVRRVSGIVGVLAAIVVAGCTTPSEGEPVSATTVETTNSSDSGPTSTSSGRELPFAGAPKVDDPLDTNRFQQDPCLALTADQAQSLTLPATGKPRTMSLGKACEWNNPNDTGSATVHFLDQNPYGLSAEYQAHNDGTTAFFEPLSPIAGYPAVVTGNVDARDQGLCTVVVGVSDKIAFEVPITLSLANIGQKDPCASAAMVAGLTLETMKKG